LVEIETNLQVTDHMEAHRKKKEKRKTPLSQGWFQNQRKHLVLYMIHVVRSAEYEQHSFLP
jgi:hypothetical protein